MIAIVAVGYYIADRHTIRYDLTENKRFTISDKTRKILGKLDGDVTAYVFLPENSAPWTDVEGVMKEYRIASKKFHYKMIDPNQRPSEAKKYSISGYGGVVMEKGSIRKTIRIDEIYQMPVDPTAQEPPKFQGEQAFTNALVVFSGGKSHTICFVEGHGERNIQGMDVRDYSTLSNALASNNYTLKAVQLPMQKQVPGDCSAIVVAGPEKPVSSPELEMMNTYLNGGGRALFLVDPMTDSGLEPLLDKWNVTIDRDFVIDMKRSVPQDPMTFMPEVENHKITEPLLSSRLGLALTLVRSVTPKIDADDVTPFLYSSESSWAEKDVKNDTVEFTEGKDVKGPIPLGVAVSKKKGKSETRLVVIGDADFPSNLFTNQDARMKVMTGGAGNQDLMVNALNWLVGEEHLISIAPKDIDSKPLNIAGRTQTIGFVTIVLIPLCLVGMGIFAVIRRRSK